MHPHAIQEPIIRAKQKAARAAFFILKLFLATLLLQVSPLGV